MELEYNLEGTEPLQRALTWPAMANQFYLPTPTPTECSAELWSELELELIQGSPTVTDHVLKDVWLCNGKEDYWLERNRAIPIGQWLLQIIARPCHALPQRHVRPSRRKRQCIQKVMQELKLDIEEIILNFKVHIGCENEVHISAPILQDIKPLRVENDPALLGFDYAPRPPNDFIVYRCLRCKSFMCEMPDISTQQASIMMGKEWRDAPPLVKLVIKKVGALIRGWYQIKFDGIPPKKRQRKAK